MPPIHLTVGCTETLDFNAHFQIFYLDHSKPLEKRIKKKFNFFAYQFFTLNLPIFASKLEFMHI